MKKEISKIIMVIAFLVTVIGILIDALTLYAVNFSILEIAAVFAVCFVFAKNNTVKNFGYAIATLVGIIALSNLIISFSTFYSVIYITSIGEIIYLVASICFFIPLLLKFFGFVKSGKDTVSGDISTILSKYKEMEKDKIITEEEFAALKSKTLKVGEKQSFNIEDLKKWKKLLDQSIITEEEYTQLKNNVLL